VNRCGSHLFTNKVADERVRLFAIDRDPNGYTTINRVTITEELLEKGKQGLALSDL
jgi:hypothetical protein